MFKCERCGNDNPRYIGMKNGKPYCRFCIGFKGETAEYHQPKGGSVVMDIKYPLSKEQKTISSKVKENFINGIDTLIDAVCGAGKTELVYEVMAYALSTRKTVAFAVPRRDVVIELLPRIKSVFPSNSVVGVYGGHTSNLKADIVVLTTHQLFRFPHDFDLIILDEIDAFPFKDNELLMSMLNNAKRGRIVMMSATPSKEIINEFSQQNHDILHLYTRFHHHAIPVPKLVISYGIFKYYSLIKQLRVFFEANKPVFIFCPTIDNANIVYKFLKRIFKKGNVVHSKREDREKVIKDFKDGHLRYLVTTAVLERGVTIKDLQVVVMNADSSIYDEYALIQIAGRVGRKYDAPEGEVVFYADKNTDSISNAINTIRTKNKELQNML